MQLLNTFQEINDAIWRDLKAQGFRRAIVPDLGVCRYRVRGKKCAVGTRIPDSRYHSHIENETIRELLRKGYTDIDMDAFVDYKSEDQIVEFLASYQIAHDNAFTPDEMQKRLHNVAQKYRLSTENMK